MIRQWTAGQSETERREPLVVWEGSRLSCSTGIRTPEFPCTTAPGGLAPQVGVWGLEEARDLLGSAVRSATPAGAAARDAYRQAPACYICTISLIFSQLC